MDKELSSEIIRKVNEKLSKVDLSFDEICGGTVYFDPHFVNAGTYIYKKSGKYYYVGADVRGPLSKSEFTDIDNIVYLLITDHIHTYVFNTYSKCDTGKAALDLLKKIDDEYYERAKLMF